MVLTLANGREEEHFASAAKAAASVWNGALVECAAPRVEARRVGSLRLGEPSWDGRSDLVWAPAAERECGARERFDCEGVGGWRAAYTTIRSKPRLSDGRATEHTEADIVVEAARGLWHGPDGSVRLMRTIAHEIGHVLGLGHPCVAEARPGDADSCEPYLAAGHLMVPGQPTGAGLPDRPAEAEVEALCEWYGRASGSERGVSASQDGSETVGSPWAWAVLAVVIGGLVLLASWRAFSR